MPLVDGARSPSPLLIASIASASCDHVLVTTLQKRVIISAFKWMPLEPLAILANLLKSNYGISFEVRKIERETSTTTHYLAWNAWKWADRVTPSPFQNERNDLFCSFTHF
jgi:hypothetical protein